MTPENHLVADAYSRLSCLEGITVALEVPVLGRYVDLVFTQSESIVSVEFKLRDWRRAIVQARDHLLGADFSFICLPPRDLTNPLAHAIAEAGLGLLLFETAGPWPFREVIPAPRSTETWSVARANVLRFMNERPN